MMVAIISIHEIVTDSCPLLIDPDNGILNCSLGDDGVPSYEDTCSFTCNTGYELTGSDTRTCQSDGSWSDIEAMCRRGKYAKVQCSIVLSVIKMIMYHSK